MRTALLIGAIAIGGVSAGVALERTGLISPLSDVSVVAALDAVGYSECPAAPAVGDLHRGDRLFATGRSSDGAWAEVRAPYDLRSRVWVRALWLIPDSSLQALPGVECESSAFDTPGEPGVATTSGPSRIQ